MGDVHKEESSVDKQHFRIKSADGKTQLHGIVWKPQTNDVKGIVQIVHGMQEYMERYDEFARFLCTKGYVVAGHDQLGHGDSVESNKDLGYFCSKDTVATLIQDIRSVQKMIIEEYPDKQFILFGHSFGSYLAREYITEYGNSINAVILSGCGMQSMKTVNMARIVGRWLKLIHGEKYRSPFMNNVAFGHYLDRIDNPETTADWLSHNMEENKRYVADPKCNYTFTLNGFFTIGDLVECTQDRNRMQKIPKDLPVLFISGEEDPVGDYGEAVKRIYHIYRDDLKLNDVEMKLYKGQRHELLHEPQRQGTYNDVAGWIEKRI